MIAAAPLDLRTPYSAKRHLPEPPRHRRVSRSAPPPQDALGRVLEEWLSEIRIRYTYDAD